MSVSYEYYKIFYFIAKYKSFSKAAKELMNSQSNLTRTINNLEVDLGCQLFVRSHKGVTLTPAGEKLYSHVAVAHRHIQMGEAEIASMLSSTNDTFTLGISMGIPGIFQRKYLLPILCKYRNEHPETHFRIVNDSTPMLTSKLSSGSIDLAIITYHSRAQDSPVGHVLCSVQDVLIGGPAYSKLSKKPLYISELSNYPMIAPWKNTDTYHFYHDFFVSQEHYFTAEIEAATSDQILAFVENNMGLGFVPYALAKASLDAKRVIQIPLAESLPLREIAIIHGATSTTNPAAAVLEQMILDSFSTIQQE